MDRKYWIHRSFKKPGIFINAIFGNWYNVDATDKTFVLINFNTYFQVYEVEMKNEAILMKKLVTEQPFMSKVAWVCKGPKEDNVDTFFALRQKDIINLYYNEREHIFTARSVLEIAPLATNPTKFFYKDNILLYSCEHGAICIQKTDKVNQLKCIKPCGCILDCFQIEENTITRIESGEKLVTYDFFTLSVHAEKSVHVDGMQLYYAFPFNGKVILCYTNNLFGDKEREEVLYYLYNKDDNSLTRINTFDDLDSKIVSSAPFSYSCTAVLTEDNTIHAISETDTIKRKAVPAKKMDAIIKLLPFCDNNILVVSCDNINSISLNPNDHQLSFRNNVGQQGLSVMNTTQCVPSMVTYTNTPKVCYTNHMKQGLNVGFNSQCELSDLVTGVFFCQSEKSSYLVVSFENSSKIFEISPTRVAPVTLPGFKENVKTIGAGSIIGKNSYLVQAKQDGVFFIPFSDQGKEQALSKVSNINFFVSTHKQFIFVTDKKKIHRYEMQNDNLKVEYPNEAQYDITALCLAGQPYGNPQAQNIFEWRSDGFAIALTESKDKNMIHFYQLEPFEPIKKGDIQVICKVSSLCGITNDRYIAGLENGLMLIIKYEKGQKSGTMLNAIQSGPGPCRLSLIDRFTVLATSLKTWRIQRTEKTIEIDPIAIHSISYAAQLSTQRFIAVTGKTMESVAFEKVNDVSLSRTKEEKVVKICPVPETPYFFTVTSNSVSLSDQKKSETWSLEKIPKEEDGEKQEIVDFALSDPFLADAVQQLQPAIAGQQPKDQKKELHMLLTILIRKGNKSIIHVHDMPKPVPNCVKTTAAIEEVVEIPFTHVATRSPINDCQPILIAATSTSLYSYAVSFEDNELHLLDRTDDCCKDITQLIVKGNKILIGDSINSVQIAEFQDTNSLKIVARDESRRRITALAPTNRPDGSFCGGDAFGNVFFYNDVHDKFTSSSGLKQVMTYNVGDIVTGVSYSSDTFNSIWYSTISGGFGGFITYTDIMLSEKGEDRKPWQRLTGEKLNFLKYVENKVSWHFAMKTNCAAFGFHCKQYPSSGIIDLDIIDLLFLLPKEIQEKIIKEYRSNFTRNDLLEIVQQFKSHFWNWKSR